MSKMLFLVAIAMLMIVCAIVTRANESYEPPEVMVVCDTPCVFAVIDFNTDTEGIEPTEPIKEEGMIASVYERIYKPDKGNPC